MKKTLQIFGFAIGALLIFCVGACSGQMQLVPPPPVQAVQSDPSFTPADRIRLSMIYRMVCAMHTRLFPLSEEQKILNGGTVEDMR